MKTYVVRQVLFSETERLAVPVWVVDRMSIHVAIDAVRDGDADSHFQNKAEAEKRAAFLNGQTNG